MYCAAPVLGCMVVADRKPESCAEFSAMLRGPVIVFNVNEPFEYDPTALAGLARFVVSHGQADLGHVSHLLIDHETDRAEWAVLTDARGTHRAVPVGLFEAEEDDEERLRVAFKGVGLTDRWVVTSPDESTVEELRRSVNALVDHFSGAPGVPDVVSLSPDYEVVRLAHALPSDGPPDQGGAYRESSRYSGEWGQGPGQEAGGEVSVGEQYFEVRGGQSGGPGEGVAKGGEPHGGDGPEWIRRELVADFPKSVTVEAWFTVEVSVVQSATGDLTMDNVFDLPGGVIVTVVAAVPDSFEVQGGLTRDIAIPQSGDSHPVAFTLRPRAVGSSPLRFTAYRGGTWLGRLEVEVAVGEVTSSTSRAALTALDVSDSVAGEASLQIMYDPQAKTFRFLFIAEDDERWDVPSLVIEGDIRDRIETLIPQFDSYAAARTDLAPEEAQERMKNEGFRLWEELVPEPIKAAIWENLGRISQLTIFCDREVVPWELLYPLDEKGHEPGFLIEQFPVARWVMNSKRGRTMTLNHPTFVIPDGSPSQAFDEVYGIAARLNSVHASTLRDRGLLRRALNNPTFDCLHFACHNEYDSERGSYIVFSDGDFRPVDLAMGAKKRPLAATKPLVFLNACRTQGSAPVYTSLENWADAFLRAGAAAVIGTSWAVRDSTARLFADTVYKQLLEGSTLGASVTEARQRSSATLGDSTWLAYTVYGDPRAKVDAS